MPWKQQNTSFWMMLLLCALIILILSACSIAEMTPFVESRLRPYLSFRVLQLERGLT
jgi:hypothetical protein